MISVITTKRLNALRNQLTLSTILINDLTGQVRGLQRQNRILLSRVMAFEEKAIFEDGPDTLPRETEPGQCAHTAARKAD